jgi:hypothetical protein
VRASTETASFGDCTAMADYYSILTKAVDALDPNTGVARRQLYERARAAMIAKIERAMPPFPGSEVAAAKVAAIAKVEADAVSRRPIPKATSTAGPNRTGHSAPQRPGSWLTEVLERAQHECGSDEQDFAPKPVRRGDE